MPIWSIKLIGGLLILSTIGGGLTFLHHKIYKQGWNARDVIAKADEVKIQADARNKLDAAIVEARQKELKLSMQLADISTKHSQENSQYERKISKLNTDLRTGAVRLSIATRSVPPCAPPGSTTTTSQPSAETRAELMPADADFLTRIATDSDRYVRQLNSVIDAYEALRSTCN